MFYFNESLLIGLTTVGFSAPVPFMKVGLKQANPFVFSAFYMMGTVCVMVCGVLLFAGNVSVVSLVRMKNFNYSLGCGAWFLWLCLRNHWPQKSARGDSQCCLQCGGPIDNTVWSNSH